MKANSKNVSVAPKAGSPQPPAPTSGAWGPQQPGGVPAAPRALAGLPASNRGSELFSSDSRVAAKTKEGVVSALRAADLATPETFSVNSSGQ